MKKLKGLDFKALFINHGEKFGLGFIVLFVLFALSGTSWSRFEKTPDELDVKVKEAKARITSPQNVWPLAKQEKYTIVDFSSKENELFTGLENTSGKYEFTTPLFWPLYRKKEKAREPEFLAALNLYTTPGWAVLQISTQPKLPAIEEAMPEEAPSDSNLKDPGLRPGTGQGGGAFTTSSGTSASSAYGIQPTRAPAGPPGRTSAMGNSAAAHGMMTSGEMPGYGSMGSGVAARGYRYVAVRAIVPIKEQIEKAMKSLNMNYSDASAAIEYTDFVLERQTAEAGSDPWSGPWVKVDVKAALKVLEECADYDPDPVPQDLQDSVITMPLPYRMLRYWGDDATHPNIKHFQLSKEEMEREEKMYSKLKEEAEKLNLEAQPKVQKKGLYQGGTDVRGLANMAMRSSDSSTIMSSMMQTMNESGGQRMQIPDIKSRMGASGRLYLFRYFDFEVEPGMAYRYRLKLELKNPNFERPYDEVENEAFTRGPYRNTDWSNISNPSVVPDAANYFLKDVERDPSREDKHAKKPIASIAMFQTHESLGTLLADTLKIDALGQFISEKKKSWILDPATPSFKEEEVQFVSEDLLVDAIGDLELSPSLHPDLRLKSDRGRRDVALGLLPEALIATAGGELKELDPVSDAKKEQSLDKKVEEERRNFQYLKDQVQQEASPLDGGAYPGMPGMPGMPSSNDQMTGGKRSFRKPRGGGASGAHGGGSSSSGDGPASAHGGGSSSSGRSSGPGGRNGRGTRGSGP